MSKRELKEIATSFTTTVFVIIGLSGVMLYFKWFNSYVKELHEILGLAFVVIVALHVFVNWNAMKSYFSKKMFYISCLVVLAISSFFVIKVATSSEVSPKGLALKSIAGGTLKDALKVMKIDYESAKSNLNARYNKNLDDYNSLNALGKDIGVDAFGAISVLLKK